MFLRAVTKPKVLFILLLVITIIIILLTIFPLSTLVKFFSIISSAASVLMIIVIFKTYRKEREYKRKSYLITLYTCLLTLSAYALFYNEYYRIYFIVALVSFFVGVLFGAQWSKSTKLYLKSNRVFGQNSGWWLIFWVFSFGITQTLSQLSKGESFYLSIILIAFSSGNSIGFSSGIIKDIKEVLATGKLERKIVVNTKNLFCPYCRAPLGYTDKHCSHCGKPIS